MKLSQKIAITLFIILLFGITFFSLVIHLITESWWFNSVGFADVFWTKIRWKIIFWIGSFVVSGVILSSNYWIALYLTRHQRFYVLDGSPLAYYRRTVINIFAGVLIVFLAIIIANSNAQKWETILKYFHFTNFSIQEPIFNKDLAFYIFELPFYQLVKDNLLGLCIFSIAIAVAVYSLKGANTRRVYWQNLLSDRPKFHLGILVTFLFGLIALNLWLQRYNLLYTGEGVVFGAGYTDANIRTFAYGVMTILTLILGALVIVSLWQKPIKFLFTALVIYGFIAIGLMNIYPAFIQRFVVEPNELEKEKPYIQNNIQFTRQAYNLDKIAAENYPAQGQLTQADFAQNQATLNNIRLWDYRPLLATYRQLQEIRLYYKFENVDVDRYTFDGNYQQVMLSPRELSSAQLPQRAKTWVNQRLKYTHGYGLVMNSVNEVTSDGLPQLLIKDVPPVTTIDLPLTQPRIYYGQLTDTPIYTGMSTEEFDYPVGENNAFTKYDGQGGVSVPDFWRRLLYAYEFRDFKILISRYFTPNSRVHYYRQIQQRVNHIAPFLRLDPDPYLAVINGRLQWIVDGYTVSNHYPYAEPISQTSNLNLIPKENLIYSLIEGNINYIRNSVKVVVDAYDGTMRFFVVDQDDPILATYRQIFPRLFITEEIPPEIRSHFRYPQGIFTLQAQAFLSYHMDNPQVFYNQEDLWRFPTEVYEGNEQMLEPYYGMMRLPGATQTEFLLFIPFTPANRNNMIAWLAVGCDGEHYGDLRLYEFPKQELVYGPAQIEARIDQNPEISQQLTLWSQRGSRVIRGNLLVIPIAQSLLYVEPVYLRAEQGQLPQMKRVIIAHNQEIVMEATLEKALAAIFSDRPSSTTPLPSTKVNNPELAQKALESYNKAQEALRQGDWIRYGQYQQELGQWLQQLNQ